jgi:DNA helicase-2/ATP-dependent DNA helicase PcrA
VAAEIGLALDHGGHSGTVDDLTESAATLQVGAARLKVPFGSEVRVRGVTVELSAPGTRAGSLGPTEKYESALREWRSEAAKEAAVPAYVVLNDSELVGIASSRPKTLAELARCKGVGPVRLERWGDELLAALDGAEGVEASGLLGGSAPTDARPPVTT